MMPLTKEEKRAHRTSRRCYICKKKFCTDDKKKNIRLEIIGIILENIEVLLMTSAT